MISTRCKIHTTKGIPRDNVLTILEQVSLMQIPLDDLTLEDIDEALSYLQLKLQDRYGNRLTYTQRTQYIQQVDELLDARLELKAYENIREGDLRLTT